MIGREARCTSSSSTVQSPSNLRDENGSYDSKVRAARDMLLHGTTVADERLPGDDPRGLFEAHPPGLGYSRNTPSNHPLHSTARLAAELATPSAPLASIGATPLLEVQPLATQPIDDLPRLLPEFDRALSGDAVRRSTSTPNASDHSLPDPDTLSLGSTDSPRAQLRLVNQRIDNVYKVIRIRTSVARAPFVALPLFKKFKIHPSCSTSRLAKATTISLLGMRQKEDEPLGQYLTRFTKEILDVHPSLVIQALMIEIRPPRFFWSLMERPSTTMLEMLQRPNQYIREKGLLKAPNLMRTQSESHDRGHYRRFPRDYDHDNEECYDLKNQIEDLIRRGHLDQFVRKSREPSLRPKGPVERQINVIVGSPSRAVIALQQGKLMPAQKSKRDLDHDAILRSPSRSSVDILYFDTFLKLGVTNRDLTPIASTLTGFTRDGTTLAEWRDIDASTK
ncbi:hypothetical protein GW17_00030507 [Ensete ventricosum]|nr:hypothetical protein GW17_00030507 [Ensete ventricosum]